MIVAAGELLDDIVALSAGIGDLRVDRGYRTAEPLVQDRDDLKDHDDCEKFMCFHLILLLAKFC